jgi:hypothetical protein
LFVFEEKKMADSATIVDWLVAGSRLWTSDERLALCNLASSEAAIVAHCSPSAETTALQLIPLLASIAPYFHMRGKQRHGVSILSRVLEASGIEQRDFVIEGARADFAEALLEKKSAPSAPFPIAPPERVLGARCCGETVDIGVWRAAVAQDAARGGAGAAVASAAGDAGAGDSRVADLMRACFLDGLGQNAYAATDYVAAWRSFANAHDVATQHPGVDAAIVCSRALDGAGRVARERGDYALSLELHAAALRAASGVDEGDGGARRFAAPSLAVCCANALSNAGVACYRLRDLDVSAALHTRALALREASGEQRGLASSLGNLALVHATRGGAEGRAAAAPLYARSLKIRRDLEDTWGVAGSLRALADLALDGGDAATASARAREAVEVFAAVGDALGVAECLETAGRAVCSTDAAAAAKRFGAAVRLRRSLAADEAVVMRHAAAEQLRDIERASWDEGEASAAADTREGTFTRCCALVARDFPAPLDDSGAPRSR